LEIEVRDPSDHLAEWWVDEDPSGDANGLTVDGTAVTATFPACAHDLVRIDVFERIADGALEEIIVMPAAAERPGACAAIENETLQRVHLRFHEVFTGETVTLWCADPDCGTSVTLG